MALSLPQRFLPLFKRCSRKELVYMIASFPGLGCYRLLSFFILQAIKKQGRGGDKPENEATGMILFLD